MKKLVFIFMDIEGMMIFILFVVDVLFFWFCQYIGELLNMMYFLVVWEVMDEIVSIVNYLEGLKLLFDEEIIVMLDRWCLEDKKIILLKVLQGILWEKGYKNGELKVYFYFEVVGVLIYWYFVGICFGVFLFGFVVVQKLLFGYSEVGDLMLLFSYYFDMNIGGKWEIIIYCLIVFKLQLDFLDIFFFSDIVQELEVVDVVGF